MYVNPGYEHGQRCSYSLQGWPVKGWWDYRAFNPGCLHFVSLILSSEHNCFHTKHLAEYQGGICLSWESAGQPLCGLLAMLQTAPAGTKRQTDRALIVTGVIWAGVVAVGRVGFTQRQCEVTVRYCDKIERGQSYSRGFCWQETGTLIPPNFVMRAEPNPPASLCVSSEKTAVS